MLETIEYTYNKETTFQGEFLLTEAFGIWGDTNHYIYMLLSCILHALRRFGICNDGLLLPTNNHVLVPALHCYLEKLVVVQVLCFFVTAILCPYALTNLGSHILSFNLCLLLLISSNAF